MKSNRLFVGFIVLSFLISFLALPYMPDEIAIHWNAAGEPDDFANKYFGAFIIPFVIVALYSMLKIVPKVDPKKANYDKFKSSYAIMMNALGLVFFIIHLGMTGYNLGYNIDISFIVPLAIGVLFIIIGNYMPKFKHNYFVGIRTPWTLANENVWTKTHRLGGKVFVIMGITAILTIFLEGNWRFIAFITITLGGTAYLIVKSYLFFKNEEK